MMLYGGRCKGMNGVSMGKRRKAVNSNIVPTEEIPSTVEMPRFVDQSMDLTTLGFHHRPATFCEGPEIFWRV